MLLFLLLFPFLLLLFVLVWQTCRLEELRRVKVMLREIFGFLLFLLCLLFLGWSCLRLRAGISDDKIICCLQLLLFVCTRCHSRGLSFQVGSIQHGIVLVVASFQQLTTTTLVLFPHLTLALAVRPNLDALASAHASLGGCTTLGSQV